MRVCFLIPSLGDGGAQRQCIALVHALQALPDIEVHLLLLGPGVHDDALAVMPTLVHRTDVGNFANPAALLFVVRTLRRVRLDLLLSWLHPADIWSFAATRFVRGIPWVVAERGSAYPDRTVFRIRRHAVRRGASAIIANSEQGRRFWATAAPSCESLVIPNLVLEPVDASGTRADRSAAYECLSVGRLEPEKNLVEMTGAFARFATTHQGAHLVVVGRGSTAAEIEGKAERSGMTDRVHLVGFRRDVRVLMARARVFLSFSRYEGMPNVVMEAIAAGLPAVVSDIPEHRALLGDDYPYYVTLGAPAESAAEVIADAWTRGLSAGGDVYAHARRILDESRPDKVAASYVDAFKSIISGRSTVDRTNPAV